MEPPPDLHGFGGLHGGLTAAALTHVAWTSIRATPPLRRVEAQLLAPIRTPFDIVIEPLAIRRRGGVVNARACTSDGSLLAAVTATFGDGRTVGPDVSGRQAPAGAGSPRDWETFSVPVEFIPIVQHVEIRPVGANRPYAGGDEPALTAWLRSTEHDDPPGPLDLVVLLDMLAPSYAAVLTELRAVPTVSYAVTLTGNPPASAWLLLRAITRSVSAGWVDEDIEAWDERGTLVARARQLRVVR